MFESDMRRSDKAFNTVGVDCPQDMLVKVQRQTDEVSSPSLSVLQLTVTSESLLFWCCRHMFLLRSLTALQVLDS